MIPLLIAAAAIGGFIWWESRRGGFDRRITLRQDDWYHLAVRDSSGSNGESIALMMQNMGFCEVSNWTVNIQPPLTEVQMTARWCYPDMRWEVPDNISITKAMT